MGAKGDAHQIASQHMNESNQEIVNHLSNMLKAKDKEIENKDT